MRAAAHGLEGAPRHLARDASAPPEAEHPLHTREHAAG